jgi:hypothetical protein
LPIADFQLRFTMVKFPDYNSTIAVQLAIGNPQSAIANHFIRTAARPTNFSLSLAPT